MPNPSYDLNSVLQFGRLVEFGNALYRINCYESGISKCD